MFIQTALTKSAIIDSIEERLQELDTIEDNTSRVYRRGVIMGTINTFYLLDLISFDEYLEFCKRT